METLQLENRYDNSRIRTLTAELKTRFSEKKKKKKEEEKKRKERKKEKELLARKVIKSY